MKEPGGRGDGSADLVRRCGTTDLVGYLIYRRIRRTGSALTVAFNGQPLTTKFHPYRFGAKRRRSGIDPLQPMKTKPLIYIRQC